MRYLSVCSGIESATVAWHPLGWSPVAFSEIEPFPCKVLAHHYPDVPNWGDMTKFKEWPDADVDVLVGGTPCQSFSIAGLRKGLDDPRGNLMLTYGAIARKYRPKWVVWENVPGVLSSDGGRDFASFLGLMSGQRIECPASGWKNSGIVPGIKGAYGLAWRVLDAQYFGVAQRRRRVFVIGYLGDWRRAAAVLFERHSLSGHPAPSREKRKDDAGAIARGAFSGSAGGRPEGASGNHFVATHEPMCMAHGQGGAEVAEGIGTTLTCNHEAPVVAYGIAGNCIDRKPENGGNGLGADDSGVMYTLTKQDRHAVAIGWSEELTATRELAGTLQRGGDGGRNDGVMLPTMQVRRLTPTECERLQGFPDGWTDIKPNGKPTPDSSRYKALGNSMAVPVMSWIGRRILAVNDIINC